MIGPIIFTVPHSGTRFTIDFFECLNFHRWNTNLSRLRQRRITDVGVLYHQQHTGEWMDQGHFTPEVKYALENNKVVITIRHPMKTLYSFLRRNRTLEQNITCWKSLLEWLPKTDHYIFDIGCEEEERLTQMLGILTHIDQDTETNREITKQYVDKWEPVNVTEGARTKNKNATIEDVDYHKLDFAVEWYKSLPTNPN